MQASYFIKKFIQNAKYPQDILQLLAYPESTTKVYKNKSVKNLQH